MRIMDLHASRHLKSADSRSSPLPIFVLPNFGGQLTEGRPILLEKDAPAFLSASDEDFNWRRKAQVRVHTSTQASAWRSADASPLRSG